MFSEENLFVRRMEINFNKRVKLFALKSFVLLYKLHYINELHVFIKRNKRKMWHGIFACSIN